MNYIHIGASLFILLSPLSAHSMEAIKQKKPESLSGAKKVTEQVIQDEEAAESCEEDIRLAINKDVIALLKELYNAGPYADTIIQEIKIIGFNEHKRLRSTDAYKKGYNLRNPNEALQYKLLQAQVLLARLYSTIQSTFHFWSCITKLSQSLEFKGISITFD